MAAFDILLMYKTLSAGNKRAFDRRIRAGAVIGSILVAALVAMAVGGLRSVRPGHAITYGNDVPAFSAAGKRSERSGVLLEYPIVF